MRQLSFLLALCVLGAFTAPTYGFRLPKSELTNVNGGIPCATCTVIVTLVEELAYVYNETIDKSMERFCSYLPAGIFQLACEQSIETFGPIIINGIYNKESSDVICHTLDICRTDKGQPECHVYPLPSNGHKMPIYYQTQLFKEKLAAKKIKLPELKSSICDNKIFKPICELIAKIFQKKEPAVDNDSDGHSTYPGLRGSSWKGKDCNDFSAKIYPGTLPVNKDIREDSNCNGIYGQPANSSKTYEELFCQGTDQMGVAVLGDSISAHFHLPEQWFDATTISSTAFQNLLFILENEIDWPELSALTGYMNSTWPVTLGPTRSIYNNLWQRNKCNFRDFQNVAVNGADTNSMLNIIKSLARDQQKDQPMIVFYTLVGNDVCNGNPDTFKHMTPPDVYYKNIIQAMSYLDTKLPKGSHVLLTGLANGSLLYDALHDRVYPLGQVKGDIKYPDFYTYLSCLQLSPCNGWMTTNATVRKMTTDYAVQLSSIVKNITMTQKFKNFDMMYADFPINPVIAKWEAQGGQVWQLIEPIDGFHMNQIANAMVADEYWNLISTTHPDWLGRENPNNDQITKIFGDQGGY